MTATPMYFTWKKSLTRNAPLVAFLTAAVNNSRDQATDAESSVNQNRIFTKAEVAKHNSKEKGIWVIHGSGVYDITSFVANHPGGEEKIMLAAGSSVDPYWRIYRQHYNSKLPESILAERRIGSLDAEEAKQDVISRDTSDPYINDPHLSPALIFHQERPINAESPGTLLGESWITPVDLWFMRNHHPVPTIVEKGFSVSVGIEGKDSVSYSLDDLKTKFKQFKVTSSIQCGGNRRSEMNQLAMTNGSPWGISAMSTAEWTGVRFADVFAASGVTLASVAKMEESAGDAAKNGLHVQFQSIDGLEASIPATKALSSRGDVILAHEMNGLPIPPGHGYPLRVIVPGHVGVRNVKWVSKIQLSREEARGAWQRGMSYKGFGPSTKSIEGLDVEKIPSLQEQPVQSAITSPRSGTKLTVGANTVKGYAYSGGGRGIVRVDVSADNGKTWKTATLLEGSEQPMDRAWAWTFWECEIDIPNTESTYHILCKATDASYNVQPDTVRGIWNLRGINNNAWHKVEVAVIDEDDDSNE